MILLMEDAYRTGLSETLVCECGFDRDPAGHFLLCFTRYKEARTEISETVSDMFYAPQLVPTGTAD